MKRIVFAILAATLSLLVIAVPVLAAYWAYLVIEETNGTSYSDLPVIALRNITQLANYGIITSSGLDTRVLTGDGEVLPHMLADDRVCVVSDLIASEKKQLIFYTGATSLSSFPIIVGYGGNISTADVPELEMGYVYEVLVTGLFDASAGANKNILYKNEAFKMFINGANNLSVEALNSTDVQWELHYSNFTTGAHSVYVVCNGMQALLYVDDFVTAKDTANLWENANQQMTGTSSAYNLPEQSAGYANGRFWCFYVPNATNLAWRSSTDGDTWDVEQSVALNGTDALGGSTVAIYYRGDYVHLGYSHSSGKDVMYRRGELNSNGTITWSAAWQTAVTEVDTVGLTSMAVDADGYPFVCYRQWAGVGIAKCTKSSTNDGTWTTAGGYPFYVSAYADGIAEIAAYYNNDDMYIMYISYTAGGHTLQGNYYNGAAWGGLHTIDTSADQFYDWRAASDADGNLYIVWLENMVAEGYDFFLRIRYSDGSWSSVTKIADGTTSLQDCCITYNPDTDCVYIFHDKPSDANLYGYTLVLATGTLVGPYTYSSAPATITDIESSAYSENLGISTFNGVSTVAHQYLTFSWIWNDNANDWYWMQNNVMSYANLLEMAVDGTIHLEYEPNDMIHGNTLLDLSGATGNNGTINWGANPPGVTAYLTAFEGGDETPPASISPNPNGTAPGDMVGPTGQPGSSQTLPTLPSHPLYPFLAPLATLSGIPLGIMWILFAMFLVIVAMLITYKYVPHLMMTVFVGGGLTAFFYHMGIFPFWVLIIFVIGAIAIIIAERMVSVD